MKTGAIGERLIAAEFCFVAEAVDRARGERFVGEGAHGTLAGRREREQRRPHHERAR